MGASAKAGGTSGGAGGASGSAAPGWRRPATLTLLAFAGFGLVYMVVNATSMIDERQALGQPVAAWKPWVWEATSFIAWLALLPLMIALTARFAMLAPIRALAGHAFAFPLISLAHSGLMIALRHLAYLATAESYRVSGPVAQMLVYEMRKDGITYGSVTLAFLLIRRLVAPAEAPLVPPEPALIEVRDGSNTIWLRPDEIDWIAAAGNYVELHGPFGTRLARRTLVEMEAELAGQGFVRVHRSRLVRRAAVASIDTRQSGDFDLVLRSGVQVAGSRRYRAGVTR